MARREDYEHWSMGLPTGSDALEDLDAICEESGFTRGEVSRLILLTWSKARRGKVQELWGFTPGVVFTGSNGAGGSFEHQDGQTVPQTKKRRKVDEATAAAVQGLTLDLD